MSNFLKRAPVSIHLISSNVYYTADMIEVCGEYVKLYWWDGYTYQLIDTIHINNIEEDRRFKQR